MCVLWAFYSSDEFSRGRSKCKKKTHHNTQKIGLLEATNDNTMLHTDRVWGKWLPLVLFKDAWLAIQREVRLMRNHGKTRTNFRVLQERQRIIENGPNVRDWTRTHD